MKQEKKIVNFIGYTINSLTSKGDKYGKNYYKLSKTC